jgi:hypothetical protein
MSVSKSEQAILDNFLKRFKSKIKSTTMTELGMYAIQGVPAFTFVRKMDRSIAAKGVKDATEASLPVDARFGSQSPQERNGLSPRGRR